jgi:hypothetical protein
LEIVYVAVKDEVNVLVMTKAIDAAIVVAISNEMAFYVAILSVIVSEAILVVMVMQREIWIAIAIDEVAAIFAETIWETWI